VTLVSWLESREPRPPELLASRLLEVAEGTHERRGVEVVAGALPGAIAESLVHLSARVVRQLLEAGDTGRGSALSLLAADALATYAFEAQGDDPSGLEERCRWAMRHFAQVADRT